jgi:hypothetical protein
MKTLSAAILIACVPLTTANAELGKDASYFCIAEFAGGLAYDERMKKWKGTAFRKEQKFVLGLKHLRTQAKSAFTETVYDYNVTITEVGTNLARMCETYPNPQVTVPEFGWLVCDVGLREYRFNLTTKRFLSVYLVGYADGIDNENNAPSIVGGVCTEISDHSRRE